MSDWEEIERLSDGLLVQVPLKLYNRLVGIAVMANKGEKPEGPKYPPEWAPTVSPGRAPEPVKHPDSCQCKWCKEARNEEVGNG